jgi:hypothetical protein
MEMLAITSHSVDQGPRHLAGKARERLSRPDILLLMLDRFPLCKLSRGQERLAIEEINNRKGIPISPISE